MLFAAKSESGSGMNDFRNFSHRGGTLEQRQRELERVTSGVQSRTNRDGKIASLIRRRAALSAAGVMMAPLPEITGRSGQANLDAADRQMAKMEEDIRRANINSLTARKKNERQATRASVPARQTAQDGPLSGDPNFIVPPPDGMKPWMGFDPATVRTAKTAPASGTQSAPQQADDDGLPPEEKLAASMARELQKLGIIGEGQRVRKTGAGYETLVESQSGPRWVAFNPPTMAQMGAATGGTYASMTPAQRREAILRMPRNIDAEGSGRIIAEPETIYMDEQGRMLRAKDAKMARPRYWDSQGNLVSRPGELHAIGFKEVGRATFNPGQSIDQLQSYIGSDKIAGAQVITDRAKFMELGGRAGATRAMTIPEQYRSKENPMSVAWGTDDPARRAHLATIAGVPATKPTGDGGTNIPGPAGQNGNAKVLSEDHNLRNAAVQPSKTGLSSPLDAIKPWMGFNPSARSAAPSPGTPDFIGPRTIEDEHKASYANFQAATAADIESRRKLAEESAARDRQAQMKKDIEYNKRSAEQLQSRRGNPASAYSFGLF